MLTDRRWLIYILCCVLFSFSQFYRSSVAVISPDLAAELGLATGDLGLVSAAFFYAFAAMQIPVGIYLDSVGPRVMMTVLSLVAALGAAVFAWSGSAAALVAGRLLLGVGMACNLMGPLKLLTTWFSPVWFATLSAVLVSVGTAGNIMAATPLAWLAGRLGWRTTFLLFALVNLAVAVLFLLVARDRPGDPEAHRPGRAAAGSPGVLAGVRQLFARRDYWLISVGTFFRYGIYASVQALWAGPFLMVTMGLSPIAAGNVLLVMSIGLVVGSPACGWVSDAVLHSRKRVIIPGLALMAALLAVLAALPRGTGLPLLLALFFAFGFASGAGQIMYAHIKDRVPPGNAGTAMTGINFFTMVGVAFFLHVLGRAIDAVSPGAAFAPGVFRATFVLFGACLVLTALAYWLTGEERPAARAG